MPDVVHLSHYLDRYPMCWPMDQEGKFLGTDKCSDVTCPKCKQYIETLTLVD